MKTVPFALIVTLVAVLASSGCSESPLEDTGGFSPVLSGTVTGPLNEPLSGVGVHYIFSLTPVAGMAPLAKPTPTTLISFLLPAEAEVTLTILRYGTRELLATLVDHEHLAAGYQTVDFDASAFTTGLYIYQLFIGDQPPQERLMALLKLDIRELEASTPLVATDAGGHFTLPTSVLGVGVTLAIATDSPTDVRYAVISDTISLVLTKAGYQSLVVPMTVDTTRSRSLEFRMIPGGTAPTRAEAPYRTDS